MALTRSFWFMILFVALLGVFSLFSYSLTDPNLVISQNEIYWNFQTYMWQQVFLNHQLRFWLYAGLISGLFATYLALVTSLGQSGRLPITNRSASRRLLVVAIVVVTVLSLSYNALSHDVFNYMFNARMVLKYEANPHVKVALDFAQFDDWTRFMHNTHTPAPYGYGWTALSLLPSYLGGEVFLPTWLLFRLFAILSLVLLLGTLQLSARAFLNRSLTVEEVALFFLNPLVLIEVVSSMHNDLWMMVPAMLALALAVRGGATHKRWLVQLVASVALLAGSIYIKQATLALVPPWVLLVLSQFKLLSILSAVQLRLHLPAGLVSSLSAKLTNWALPIVPLLAAASMFLPLLTERSQRFLPWYWLWVLCWIPLISWKPARVVLLAFSLSSMLRYLPWLWWGEYEPQVILLEKVVTWTVGLVGIVLGLFLVRRRRDAQPAVSSSVKDGTQRLIRLE